MMITPIEKIQVVGSLLLLTMAALTVGFLVAALVDKVTK
jgi:hypothetical protein